MTQNSPDNQNSGYTLADWQKHYAENDLRWDIETPSPPLIWLWEQKKLTPGRAVIPGCGRGHEVLYFAERGFDVTAVDFAPGAAAFLERALQDKKNVSARVLQKDFFALGSEHDGYYDVMFEQTFFCAIHPSRRADYVNTVARLLKSGGLLAALFYETGEAGGPPFSTTRQDILDVFSMRFQIEFLEKTPHSIERRKDKEWLGLLRNR
jgi:SAM-dependent methyltransferase